MLLSLEVAKPLLVEDSLITFNMKMIMLAINELNTNLKKTLIFFIQGTSKLVKKESYKRHCSLNQLGIKYNYVTFKRPLPYIHQQKNEILKY